MTDKKNAGHFTGTEGKPFTSETGRAAVWKRHRTEILKRFGYEELLEDDE